jgi:hypothetical protein
LAICVATRLAVAPATKAGPLEERTPRNGIVRSNGSPVSALAVTTPSNGGRSSVLFTMTTAAAPACWP